MQLANITEQRISYRACKRCPELQGTGQQQSRWCSLFEFVHCGKYHVVLLQAFHTYTRINFNATVNRFHGIAFCVPTTALVPE